MVDSVNSNTPSMPVDARQDYAEFKDAKSQFENDCSGGSCGGSSELTKAQNKSMMDNGIDTEDDGPVKKGGGKGGGGGGGNGWLLAMAKAMGKLADAKAAALEAKTANMPVDATPSQMLELQAESQEFSLMMNAFTNVIKTLGEGNANSVRKG
jgi:hypothetical protein